MSGRRRPRKLLAIDWDLRTLRVVHANIGKREVSIERVLSVAIPASTDASDPEQMSRHIRRALDQEGITTKQAIVDIPRDQATLNTLILPAAATDELPGMVEIQIAKELPFAVSEAAVDFVAGEPEDGNSTIAVQVAAVRREVLTRYEATFAAAGLRLERIGLRPLANKVAVCELLKHAMPDRVMFIDVGPTLTEIDVVRHSVLVFSRAASVVIPEDISDSARLSLVDAPQHSGSSELELLPAKTGTGGALGEILNALVMEVTLSIEAYRATEPGASIDHVVIGGDLGIEESLADAIQQRLGISTEVYNPASTFAWEPDEGAAASAFATTLGLVLGQLDDTSRHFDFLHPKKAVSVTEQRLKMAPLVAAVAMLFIAAAGVAIAQYTAPKRARLAELEANIAELRSRESDNKRFVKLVDETREFDAGHIVWVDVLYDVMLTFPPHEELILTHVEMNRKDRRVVMKTKCKSRDLATEVVDKLNLYQRPGSEKPRFRASMGPQADKPKDRYPYSQALRIEILDDGLGRRRPARRIG